MKYSTIHPKVIASNMKPSIFQRGRQCVLQRCCASSIFLFDHDLHAFGLWRHLEMNVVPIEME